MRRPPDFSDAARPTAVVAICDDASDNLFPFTPEFNFNVMAQYTMPIGDYEIAYAADYNWQSKIYFDVINTDELSQNARGILGFRLTGRALQTNTEMSLWMKNALDETYRTAGYSLGAYVNRFYALPRTYGVRFTQRFGGL